MSNRAGRLDAAQRREVGAMVRAMRERGEPWKRIEQALGLSRVQLWRYAREDVMKRETPQ